MNMKTIAIFSGPLVAPTVFDERVPRFARLGGIVLTMAVALGAPGRVVAQNPEFQAFFFDVCGGTPTGALAVRCGETPGNGDLSGDSEESLNPAQALTVHHAALARARAAGKEIQERLETERRTAGENKREVRWSVFAHARWEGSERDATALERGFDGDLYGTQFGVDVRTSERTFFGGLVSYDKADSEFDADRPGVNFTPQRNEGESDADGLSIRFFGSHQLTEHAWIDGHVGYGQTDFELLRNAVFQEADRIVPQTDVRGVSRADGEEISGGLGIGADGHRGALRGGVYGRLNYARTEIDGFAETDASGLQMRVRADDRRSLLAVVGFQGTRSTSAGWGVCVIHGRIEYERELDDDPQQVTTSFLLDALGNQLRLTGDEPDQDAFNGGLGVTFVLPHGWSTFLDLEILAGHDYLDRQRATLGLRKEL